MIESRLSIYMPAKKWVTTLGIGLLGNWAETWAFDFVLYPFAISVYGILFGGLILTLLSFIVCYAKILFYDGTKKDWLGIETLKGIEDFVPKPVPKNGMGRLLIPIINSIGNISAWLMKKSDAFLMVVLSVKFDPFVTVIHIRHGSHQYNGLSKRDWRVFITSLIIGNVYWTLAVYMGITLAEAGWRYLTALI